jgi:hypothetical protein
MLVIQEANSDTKDWTLFTLQMLVSDMRHRLPTYIQNIISGSTQETNGRQRTETQGDPLHSKHLITIECAQVMCFFMFVLPLHPGFRMGLSTLD